MAKEGGAAERTVEAPPPETESIVWREDKGRFETPDGEAFLQYRLFHGHGGGAAPAAAVMDMVHTYVPRSKRGQGLAARLCDAAFAHARGRGMRVLPTCSYISVSNHRPAALLLLCSTRIPLLRLASLSFRWCFGGGYRNS
jgi:GNAT superfamily N-acetyltransferase